MSDITWGVDGYGRRHYLCDSCGEVFGMVDPETIEHKECDSVQDEKVRQSRELAEYYVKYLGFETALKQSKQRSC